MEDEKPLILVSVLDDAIDTEAMTAKEIVRYYETRDINLLKIKPGRKPQRYYTREVRQNLWESYVMAADTEAERYRRAFLCGVIRVTDVVQRNGEQTIEKFEPSGIRERGCMLEEDAERFSASDRAEIGSVIWERSFLAPRTVRAYRLPPTCLQILALRAFRSADAIQESQAQSNGAASAASAQPPARSDETTPEPSKSASASENPTDATAPAP